MTSTEVACEVEELLRRECRVDGPLTLDTRLVEDLGLDSLQFLGLAVALENRFRLPLDEDPEQPPATLGELIRLVEQRLAESR